MSDIQLNGGFDFTVGLARYSGIMQELPTAETEFLDYNSQTVKDFVERYTEQNSTQIEMALALYYAVRDKIRYDPYATGIHRPDFKASAIIKAGASFCIPKAIVYAATLRRIGVPSRLGYADVQNHIAGEKLLSLMETDVFYFHGYTEAYLDGKWVKATPAFDRVTCRAFKVKPLEFNGLDDSMFQEFTNDGSEYMEYLHDHGTYNDFPYERMNEVFAEYYPKLIRYIQDREKATAQHSN